MSRGDDPVIPADWTGFRRFTPARIALGRAGSALPTAVHLAFQLDHARARDAVHTPLDRPALAATLAAMGLSSLCIDSAAGDRATFLQRPDLGRVPAQDAEDRVRALGRSDIALVIADGLSARAVQRHAVPLLASALPDLADHGLTVSPAILVAQGRVAIGDPLGHWLGARLAIVLIGERPGLSSPDSLGVYLTHAPSPGRTDAERNCISNIRPEGLGHAAAARTLVWLVRESLRLKLSGVGLKDNSGINVAAPLLSTE
ncbi:MAG: ethanolamine ammonia-lyase subunit EutC [Pseudomonadota bacterium]|nr:ethanolamine ammonia-lyase subunit EutC [Pseudomonadota bacterium]